MKCQSCGSSTIVKDSRRLDNGVWRKRFCHVCESECTTMEMICETLANPYSRETKAKIAAIPVKKERIHRPKRERKAKVKTDKMPPAWKKLEDLRDSKIKDRGWD